MDRHLKYFSLRLMTDNLPVPDDAPWLNLSQEEINELRKSKKKLTEYGKQRLKELMNTGELIDTEKFQEELSKQKVFDADKFADEERKQRSDNVLRRYNGFYNDEVSGLSWGMPTSMEELQAISLSCAVDALICENMNIEYNMIAVDDIKDLIQRLYQQGRESIKNIKEFKDSADGVA